LNHYQASLGQFTQWNEAHSHPDDVEPGGLVHFIFMLKEKQETAASKAPVWK